MDTRLLSLFVIRAITALNVCPEYRLSAHRTLHAVLVHVRAVAARSAIRIRSGKKAPDPKVVHFYEKEIDPFAEREENDQIPIVVGVSPVRVDQHPQRKGVGEYQEDLHWESPTSTLL
jgi:hypothetical protein